VEPAQTTATRRIEQLLRALPCVVPRAECRLALSGDLLPGDQIALVGEAPTLHHLKCLGQQRAVYPECQTSITCCEFLYRQAANPVDVHGGIMLACAASLALLAVGSKIPRRVRQD